MPLQPRSDCLKNRAGHVATFLMLPALLLCQQGRGDATSIIDALSNGEYGLEFRYRFEGVDQNGFSDDAEASTLRTRVNYHSGSFHDFRLLLELDNVSDPIWDDYNSTRNGRTGFPVVADPTGSEVNQAWIEYVGIEGHRFAVGRQRIVLDNKRFIGGTNWRQNEQTYDAVTWRAQAWNPLDIQVGFINKTRRIFGPDPGTPSATFDGDTQYVNLALRDLPIGTLVGYAYWLDLENAPAFSSRTLGARLSGKHQWDALAADYQLEFADQQDHGDNPVDYSANYLLLEAGLSWRGWRAAIGTEQLGGDATRPGRAFQTPLAGLHKFQGWTDQFVVTPNEGVDDRFLSLGTHLLGNRILFVYHDFSAESGPRDFADETGFLVSRELGDAGSVLFKYARYESDGFAVDTDKFWVQYAIGF